MADANEVAAALRAAEAGHVRARGTPGERDAIARRVEAELLAAATGGDLEAAVELEKRGVW